MKQWILPALVLALVTFTGSARGQNTDPGSASLSALTGENSSNESQDVEALIREAQELFAARRPIDARAKLQRALQLAPEDYRPHMYLGIYYLTEVAHFQLADRYLRTAEMLFRKNFGSDEDGTLRPEMWKQNARLLQYLAEARLNLDDYAGALKIIERFGKTYWDDWYPGTKAWILMKLRRVDDAVREAQAGLLRGADPTRTYNILGILLSLKGNRQLALKAFGEAIKAELALGGLGQVATPLNNAGEVYRELFQDDLAEAAWLRSFQMPDGCDHILPSLNLAIVYTDELRLLQAERALKDFEVCFAARSVRSDTEHRALLALARGRLALRKGDIDTAVNLLTLANEREQWFGKIGTDPNDLRFAAALTLAQALEARASVLEDRVPKSFAESMEFLSMRASDSIRSWWYFRRASEIAIDTLEDIEDLYPRNTDAMLEYPTFGDLTRRFPTSEFRARLNHMMENDKRPLASVFYRLYRGENSLARGDTADAKQELYAVRGGLREIDRLAHAQVLADLLQLEKKRYGLFSRPSKDESRALDEMAEKLFELLPSHLRYKGLSLPVSVSSDKSPLASKIIPALMRARFSEGGSGRYLLRVATASTKILHLELQDSLTQMVLASVDQSIEENAADTANAINRFIDKVFGYRSDAPAVPIPQLDILENP